jgi:hypothetical protein
MNRLRSARPGVALLAAFLVGCGGDGPYPVEGKVVWADGTPATELEGALVVFDLPEKQTNAKGNVRADGTFRLTTKADGDGALAGEYKVVIVESRPPLGGPDATMMAPGHMDVKYSDPSTSDLTATVKPGTNVVTLKVERNKERGKPK